MTQQAAIPAYDNDWLGLPRYVWAQVVVLTALFVLLHYSFLQRVFWIAYEDQNWSHAFVVPLISLYFVYLNWDRVLAAAKNASTCWWALPIVLFGLFSFVVGNYPVRNDMVKGYGMIITLFGMVFWLGGFSVIKVLWFPILYLGFAIKVSDKLWEAIAWKLQNLAAKCSVVGINILGLPLGIEAEGRGNTIDLWHHGEKLADPLNVAEACSGLRMLMAFVALGAAVAYLADRPWWARITIVLLTVPIAILVNVGRVTVLGLIHPYNPELSTGQFHILIGIFMLIPALLLFLLVGWVLNNLIIDEDDESVTATRVATVGGVRQRVADEAGHTVDVDGKAEPEADDSSDGSRERPS